MSLKNLLVGMMAAVLVAAPAGAVSPSPSQPTYIVNLGLGYVGSASINAMMNMWFDPSCTTLGSTAGVPNGCPRPVSPDFPIPVAAAPAANSPGSSSGTPNYSDVQNFDGTAINGTDPTTANTVPPSGTGVRGWLGSIWGLLNGTLKVVQPDVQIAQQTLPMGTVGNSITLTVPPGMGSLETALSGLTASGGAVGFKASSVSGGPYSTFAAQGGAPLADSTTINVDGSYTINTAGHVQIQIVVLTVGTGSVTVGGNFAASIRTINARVVTSALPAGAATSALQLLQSVPTGGNLTLTTTAQTLIPAANRTRWGYQAQGTGWACASWVATPTITVSTADVATCGGSGAFLLNANYSASANSAPGVTQTTALLVIGAAHNGTTLAASVVWDAQ